MLRHLGYVGISLSIEATSNRTSRLSNVTPERLRILIVENLAGLMSILRFSRQHDIFMFRISSQIIPFASHPINTVPWWDEFAEQLADIGTFIQQNGMRVAMHPFQYTTLSAVDRNVLDNAILDLQWHMRFLECLRLNRQHKVTLHVGGVYGDKPSAKRRFIDVVKSLPEFWQERLAIENDERSYNVDDVLEVSRQTGLPVVFDCLHHNLNPGSITDMHSAMTECFATWRKADGLPDTHYSDQAIGGRPGAHADWIIPDNFVDFLARVPQRDFDCTLEAKKKDLALLKLRNDLSLRSILLERSA